MKSRAIAPATSRLYALMRAPASLQYPWQQQCIYHRLDPIITIPRVAVMQHIANQGPKLKMYVPYSI